MIRQTSFCHKVFSGLVLIMLSAVPAFSSEYVGVTCVDIDSSATPIRILELAATAVDNKYYSLAGSHWNQNRDTVGSAVGTALLAGNELIVTVNASSAVGSSMKSTLYQFNFNPTAPFGNFRSITQENINGTFTPLDYKSGQVALVSCDAGLTNFSASTIPDPPEDPTPNDPTPNDPGTDESSLVYDFDGDFDASPAFGGGDCNNTDPTINRRATEICGDGIDQNCNGMADDVCATVDNDLDNDGFESLAAGGTDCNDNNSAIKPGATEICGDGIDQNCNGMADDACATVSYPTFTDNRNGTVSQVGTNLDWLQNHIESTSDGSKLNWYSAKDQCDNLNFANATNWRLPTKDELLSTVDMRKTPVKTDTTYFPTAKATYYWTITAYSAYESWDVNFATGLAGVRGKQTTAGMTRCVRER